MRRKGMYGLLLGAVVLVTSLAITPVASAAPPGTNTATAEAAAALEQGALIRKEAAAVKVHMQVGLVRQKSQQARAKAIPDEEGFYAGTYLLKTWDGTGSGEPKEKTFEGKIACSGE